jgi:hypothetical protein
MQNTVIIPERFKGPPQSGNGGYVSGAFAAFLPPIPNRCPEITLRSPIPLDTLMQIEPLNDQETGEVRVMHEQTLIAECRMIASPFETLAIPPCPDPRRIQAALPHSLAFKQNINPLLPNQQGFHPICFCCGAEHETGLRVFPAPLEEGHVGALWATEDAWGVRGKMPEAFLWTALDCPAQFAYMNQSIKTGLMGRMTAEILSVPAAGQTLIVSAWTIAIEGKKHFAGSAIFDLDQTLLARAITVWIGGEPLGF